MISENSSHASLARIRSNCPISIELVGTYRMRVSLDSYVLRRKVGVSILSNDESVLSCLALNKIIVGDIIFILKLLHVPSQLDMP